MQTILKSKFLSWPFHLFLMPVYFLLHLYIRYGGMLEPHAALSALIKVIAGILVFFLLLKYFYSNAVSAILTTISGICFLFFGDIKYTFTNSSVLYFLGHYKVILPLIFTLLAVLYFRARKWKNTSSTSIFLNLLFLIYIISDLVSQVATNYHDKKETILFSHNKTKEQRPSIYYILSDAYPSTDFQASYLGKHTFYLDSALHSKGFAVIKNSSSNYSSTPFSMAATFSMEYLEGIDTSFQLAAFRYNYALRTIKNAPLFSYLKKEGYELANFSIFDIDTIPATKRIRFLTISTSNMIFYNCIWNSVKRDLFWQVLPGYLHSREKVVEKQLKEQLEDQDSYNRSVIRSLTNFSPVKNKNYFVYTHLLMPHYPFFFNEKGEPFPDSLVFSGTMMTNSERFASYIGYTDRQLVQLVDNILKKTNGNAVIILQSDHTLSNIGQEKSEDVFDNYNAFYFPGGNYQQLYDGMSNVNSFRVVLNKYFGQSLAMLPDKRFHIR